MARSTGRTADRRRWDAAALAAIPIAVVVAVAAYLIDGGPIEALVDVTAAVVVCAGTGAATIVSFQPAQIGGALRAALRSFVHAPADMRELAADLIVCAIRAHRRGPLVLEPDLERIEDPFLRDGLALVVDGERPDVVRRTLTAEKHGRDARDEMSAGVFETAARLAVVIGLVGAVLGLIPVLDRSGALAPAVAAALVSTLYGMGAAGLVLLPLAARLRSHAARESHRRELAIEAFVAIAQRTQPRVLAQTLRAFVPGMPPVEEIAARLRSRAAAEPGDSLAAPQGSFAGAGADAGDAGPRPPMELVS